MNTKQETQKDNELVRFIQFPNPKPVIFRNTTNKAAQGQGNGGKPAHAYMGEKADSPRNFSEKILKLVAILLWIIVGLNLIITILIYKIFFQ
jgi:hypothetical protein